MEAKILLHSDPLWNRLQSFPLDSEADFPFSKKLAQEEKWTPRFTKKAIEEYKKFVYLCCILPNGASPSEVVDKVWHMHLIYTQNYWEEFCPNILQTKLHHHPSKGGSNEKQKHKIWFDSTLKNYQEIFGQQPPADIWMGKIGKKGSKMNWLTVISVLLILSSCSDGLGNVSAAFAFIFFLSWALGKSKDRNKNQNDGGGSSSGCGGSSSGCSSSCGSSCGGGCGGCGGGD